MVIWISVLLLLIGLAEQSESDTKIPRVKPSMISKPRQYQVLRGGSVLLQCDVHNLGSSVVLWRKKDRILAAGRHLVRKDGKVSVTDDHSLELDEVEEEDAGQYVCEVDGGLGGEAMVVTHTLTVLVAPEIIHWDVAREVTSGDDVTIRCEATGNPTPSLTWRKHRDGKPIIPDESGQRVVLRNVGRRDAGLYVCKADNLVSEGVERVTRIIVNYAPEVRLEEVWEAKVETFEVRLVCHVDSHPPSQVSWFKNSNIRLSTTDIIYIEQEKGGKSTLKIDSLEASHFGTYTCRARNRLGKMERSLELTGKPRPPIFSKEQKQIMDSAEEMKITWTTDSFSPVTQYKVYYRKSPLDSVSAPSDTGDWLQSFLTVTSPQSHLTTTSSYTLRDMDNQSVYDVKVRASNKYGMSEFSPVFNFYVKTAVGDAHKDFASPRFLQKEPKEVASSSSSSGDILSPDAEPICVSVLTLVYVLLSH